MKYNKIILGSLFSLLSIGAQASSPVTKVQVTCPSGSTLVTSTYEPSNRLHGFGNDNPVTNHMDMNFTFPVTPANKIAKIYVQGTYAYKSKYDYHHFYLSYKMNNYSSLVYDRTFAAGFDYFYFDFNEEKIRQALSDGRINLSLGHIDPNGRFAEYLYVNKVTMGFCRRS